jgi:hypothetical protein
MRTPGADLIDLPAEVPRGHETLARDFVHRREDFDGIRGAELSQKVTNGTAAGSGRVVAPTSPRWTPLDANRSISTRLHVAQRSTMTP